MRQNIKLLDIQGGGNVIIQKEIFSISLRKRLVSYYFCGQCCVLYLCQYSGVWENHNTISQQSIKSYAAAGTARTMKMNSCKDTVDYIVARMIRDDDSIQNTLLQQIDQLNVGNVLKR